MTRTNALPRYLVVLGSSLLLFVGMGWSEDKDSSDIEKRLDAATRVLTEIMVTPDKAIPDKVMSDSKCIAVVPSIVKIAIVMEGAAVRTCESGLKSCGEGVALR